MLMGTLSNSLVIASMLTSFWKRHYSSGLSGKGGHINDRDIREMAIKIAQDSRFGDDPNFKSSIGWFEGKIQQLQPLMHIINANKFTAVDNDLPS